MLATTPSADGWFGLRERRKFAEAHTCIDIVVNDVTDIRVRSKRSNGTASAPITVDIFDEHIVGRALDGHTLILIRDFNIMNINVVSPDINGIKPTLVTSVNCHIVYFAV